MLYNNFLIFFSWLNYSLKSHHHLVFFIIFAVENTTHCEFAYLRDLLIRYSTIKNYFYILYYYYYFKSICVTNTVHLLINIFQYKCFAFIFFIFFRTHMQNIKDITSSIHYEMYRVRRLNENNMHPNGQPTIHANGVPEHEVLSNEM